MYATCTFCYAALGHNEVLETFPVSKRVAFDPAKGCMWAVCPHCARWNLAPAAGQSQSLYCAIIAFAP